MGDNTRLNFQRDGWVSSIALQRGKGEPAWAEWECLRHRQVPQSFRHWLLDTGSLTARLKGICGRTFRVRLLHQGWGRPLRSERQILGMRGGGIALVREVELLCDGSPWVFARTLIPATSLHGSARRLTMLGEKPLGELLFSDRRMQRGVTELACLTPRHALHAAASRSLDRPCSEIWGRRTLFLLARRPLLVNEIFLPAAGNG